MKSTSYSLISDFTWDQVIKCGATTDYYHIERWLQSEGLDATVLPGLESVSTIDLFTLWRCALILDIHQWRPPETMKRVADSLSLRCFTRMPNLNQRVPQPSHLGSFIRLNARPLHNALRFCAAVWITGSSKNARREWIQRLDRWAKCTTDEPFATSRYMKQQSLLKEDGVITSE